MKAKAKAKVVVLFIQMVAMGERRGRRKETRGALFSGSMRELRCWDRWGCD
jgi:hypothetical protein